MEVKKKPKNNFVSITLVMLNRSGSFSLDFRICIEEKDDSKLKM